MSLLLSIANAAAEAVPGLARYPAQGGGTVANSAHAPGSRSRGGWRERRQIFHSAGTGRSSAFYSPFLSSRSGGGASLGGVYRLRWYRRPLRSQQSLPSSTSLGPPSTRSDLVTFSRRPRSSFPLSVGESVGESVGGGDGDDDSDDDSTGGLTPTASPTASPSRDAGAGDSGGSGRRRRKETGSDGRQSADVGRLSVSMHSTPDPLRIPSSEDEEEDVRDSTEQMAVPAPLSLTVEAAPTPEKPDRPLAPLSRRLRERDSPPSARHAARGDAAAPRMESETVLPAPPMENAPAAPIMETIQRSEDGYEGGDDDPDEIAGGGNVGGDDSDGDCGNISISPDGDSDPLDEYENSPASTVRLLRAEVKRLKREMAAMAAATAAANCAHRHSNLSGEANAGDGDGLGSPKSPSAAPAGSMPWSWNTVENGDVGGGGGSGDRGGGGSGDGSVCAGTPSSLAAAAAAAVANATRPKSVRLRADDSWLQRGFSRETNSSRRRKSQLPQSPVSTIDGDASTTLGTPVSVAATHVDDLNNSAGVDAGAGEEEAPPVTILSPPARRHRNSVVMGPSPASGEKNMGDTSGGSGSGGDRREARASIPVAAVATAAGVLDADEARDEGNARPATVGAAVGTAATSVGSGRGSCASRGSRGGSRGGSSGHRDISVRPCPVFFPPGGAQEDNTNAKPQDAPAQAQAAAPPRGAMPEVETTASDTKYLATELASAATTAVTGATPAAPAAGTGGASTAADESSVAGADGGGGGSVRRRRDLGEGDRQLWRWVLAQRTENRTVRGALISHGLPQSERRRIWTAWATVARSNT